MIVDMRALFYPLIGLLSVFRTGALYQKESRAMPNYKDKKYFRENDGGAFDEIHTPGSPILNSGIFRCESCGFEVASIKDAPLPPTKICLDHSSKWPCDHGPVRWRLVAAAIHWRKQK